MDRVYVLKGVRSKPSKKNPEGVERHGLKKCGHCRKQFTVRVGTVFEDSHAPLHKWFQADPPAVLLQEGHQLRTSSTAFLRSSTTPLGSWPTASAKPCALARLRRRWAATVAIVEIDETIYGRAATHPKGRRHDQGTNGITNSAHKNVILSLVERGGERAQLSRRRAAPSARSSPSWTPTSPRKRQVMTDARQLYKIPARTASPAMTASTTARRNTRATRKAAR